MHLSVQRLKRELLWLGCHALLLAGAAPPLWSAEPWAYTAPVPRAPRSADNTPPLVEQAAARYAEAQQAFARSDFDAAQRAIQEGLQFAPGAPALQAFAGRIFNVSGKRGLALDLWNHLLDEYPNNATFLAERCGTLWLLGRPDDAERDLRHAVQFSPGDLTVRYYQALGEIRQRDRAAAARVMESLNGQHVLEFGKRILQEQAVIASTTHSNGPAEFARALLALPDEADAMAALQRVVALLEQLKPVMERSAWSEALPILQSIRQEGAAYPGLYYDLALCAFLLKPAPERLNDLENFVRSERGAAFARYFIYLCMYQQDYERAQRVFDDLLRHQRDEEITLIRAALAYGRGATDEAWRTLETFPPALRPALETWFTRDQPVIQSMRRDPRYAAWLRAEL